MKHALILSFALTSSSLFAYSEKLSTQQIMTPEDAKSMGIERMSPEQKAAFERWAATWTHHVLEQAPSYRPGENLTSWIQTWPSYANPTKNELTPEELEERQKNNQYIDKVKNNGQIIDLQDGSSWIISPFFIYLTSHWLKGQVIDISQSTNIKHHWILHNQTTGQTAEADLANPANPSGKKEPENPDQFKGSTKLQMVTNQGDDLSLADGTSYRVAPTDMYKAKNWSPNDRVKVESSGDVRYPVKITNLDNGQTARAIKK